MSAGTRLISYMNGFLYSIILLTWSWKKVEERDRGWTGGQLWEFKSHGRELKICWVLDAQSLSSSFFPTGSNYWMAGNSQNAKSAKMSAFRQDPITKWVSCLVVPVLLVQFWSRPVADWILLRWDFFSLRSVNGDYWLRVFDRTGGISLTLQTCTRYRK